ncbi:MAG: LysR family transcriptional regulator [Sandaracinaceae bacterium]
MRSVLATPRHLSQLLIFSMVAEHMSFTKAATKLGVAKGTVSRSVTQLEAHLGVELIHRTTHHVSLSTAGLELHERTHAHLQALQAATVQLPERDAEPAGLLRITAPCDFGSIVLPSILSAFSTRFPAVRFDVRLTDEHVDLVKGGYDVGIRIAMGRLKDSTLTVRRLRKNGSTYCASPAYIARRGRPGGLQDERHVWILHPGVETLLDLPAHTVRFRVDDFLLARDLARDGVGLVLLPDFVARPYLRDGLLEEVTITDAPLGTSSLVMLYPSSGQLSKKVSSFRDFLVEAVRNGVA